MINCPVNQHDSLLSLERTAIRHLTQRDLARRWNVSPRTLERWRWLRQGPPYLKIGGRVVYRLDDIIAYEAEQMRLSTTSVADVSLHARRL